MINPYHLLLGRQCVFCGATIDPGLKGICPECSKQIKEKNLRIPYRQPPPVALYHYDGPVRTGVQRFKYGGKIELGKMLGQQIAACFIQRGEKADVVTCIPRAKDERPRMYNQSAVIAKAAAKHLHLPFQEDLLCKRTGMKTQPQCKTYGERQRNARKAYRPGPNSQCLKGMTVLLIDDLYTTGATVRACEEILKRLGAAKVLIYTAVRAQRQKQAIFIRSKHMLHIHEEFADPSPYRKKYTRSKTKIKGE